MYDLKQLTAFVELARTMHFGKTAETLGISVSTLSTQIRNLEESVGAPLVNRGNRTMDLTRLGEAFLPDARRILALVEAAQKKTAQILAGEAATVRLGVCPSMCELGFLTCALRTVREACPSIEMVVKEGSPAFLVEWLARGRIDLVLSVDYGLYVAQPLRAKKVARLRPVLVADRALKLLTPTGEIDRERVKRATFFGLGEPGLETLPHIVESLLGAEPERVVRVPTLHVIRAYVEAGCGATVLPAAPGSIAASSTGPVVSYPIPEREMSVSVIRSTEAHAPVIGRLFELLGSIDYGEGTAAGRADEAS